ncbi:MAG: thiamine pyrophosphate-dependent enzyme [Armatimonadota bacterium]|nr:thiamine pyrophosphate-dependent enzyme [Armatimonadota bacterium]
MAEETLINPYPDALTEVEMRYCPGCTHGTAHRLVAEVIDELGVKDRTVAIATVGCSVYAYEYFDTDAVQAAHGRGPAVATGIKRVQPEAIVFTYQGDGDLASIGMAEVVHAAARGEAITIVFINNAVFGMTQGQMAPTTLLGQRTTTSPTGRTVEAAGYPIRICELLATLPGVGYLAREALTTPPRIRSAKRSIRRAFETQVAGGGFSLVELLSICPTWWGMDPLEAVEHVEERMIDYYPLKVFRDRLAEEETGGGESDA